MIKDRGATVTLATGGGAALVVYIGHNGLMDFDLPEVPGQGPGRDALVLCCMSEQYFGVRLKDCGARPLLLTTQLMYPGAFILREALAGWIRGEEVAEIRERAARAYAENQRIGLKAARGVFSELGAEGREKAR